MFQSYQQYLTCFLLGYIPILHPWFVSAVLCSRKPSDYDIRLLSAIYTTDITLDLKSYLQFETTGHDYRISNIYNEESVHSNIASGSS